MVGGISAFIGAAILGPRIGKYKKDKKTGKKVAKAIPGHSLTLGALGCFILWFGWYGFNSAAATTTDSLASIFLTTTMAPTTATVVTMIFTWIKDGKPDISMSLNASLAGLVAITAPCDCVDALSSVIIGAVSGILVVVAVEFIDKKLHVDDPVGVVAVHMVNGTWGYNCRRSFLKRQRRSRKRTFLRRRIFTARHSASRFGMRCRLDSRYYDNRILCYQ